MKRTRCVIVLAAWASFTATLSVPAALADDDLSFHTDSVTAKAIDGYVGLRKYNGKTSPLVGSGASFVRFGQTYDIDPALIVAISGIETDFALRTCTADNAWNWFWDGPCPKSPFTSFDDGIETVSKYLKLAYIDKGYNTIALIQKRYCTAPVSNGVTCPGWISTVTTFRDQLNGLAPSPPPANTGAGSTDPASAPASTASASTGTTLWLAAGGCALFAALLGWLWGRRRRS